MKSTTLFCRLIVAAIAICLCSTTTVFPRNNGNSEQDLETAFVLNQFRNKTLSECVKLMDRLRPLAVTPEEKAILRKNGFDLVNKKTEINDPARLTKLYRQTRRVLEFHHRAGIVEYILFKNSDPVLITKAGAFIAISDRALELAPDEQARAAIIAHELAHEYFALQFLNAYETRNFEKLRIIELMCDVFAIITMIELKMNPVRYAETLQKIVRHSKESEQLNDGTNGMPSLEARLQVISEINKQFSH